MTTFNLLNAATLERPPFTKLSASRLLLSAPAAEPRSPTAHPRTVSPATVNPTRFGALPKSKRERAARDLARRTTLRDLAGRPRFSRALPDQMSAFLVIFECGCPGALRPTERGRTVNPKTGRRGPQDPVPWPLQTRCPGPCGEVQTRGSKRGSKGGSNGVQMGIQKPRI